MGCQLATIPRMSITCGSAAGALWRWPNAESWPAVLLPPRGTPKTPYPPPSNKGGSLDSARPACLSDATQDREELWIGGHPPYGEIGRASCGGRGCQDV